MEQKRTRAKKAKAAQDIEVSVMPAPEVETTESSTLYPTIKRMLATLDKFLIRRIAVIAICYMAGMIVLGMGLTANGVASNASSYGETSTSSTVNAWLFSLAAVVTFLFILLIIRLVVINVAKRKESRAQKSPETKK